MPILNYTTKIDYMKTIAEIQVILAKAGVSKISTEFDNGLPISISFHVYINSKDVAFMLPCNYEGVLNALKKNGKIPKNLQTKEQAIRVAWRIVKDWTEAQLAIIEAQLCTVSEVFMPYAITNNGETFYNRLRGGDSQILALME